MWDFLLLFFLFEALFAWFMGLDGQAVLAMTSLVCGGGNRVGGPG